jgi:spore coat polysaccharide biosynthesis protein SpsF
MEMTSTKVYALIQARMSSSRFPGKVIEMLQSKPMILHQIDRVFQSNSIDDVHVLTSVESSDDLLCEILLKAGVKTYRGNLLNVHARYSDFLANNPDCQIFIRLTADCPLSCSDIINHSVKVLKENDLDYVSNTLYPTFPDGMDVEVVKRDVFLASTTFNLTKYQEEHVTPFIYQNPQSFKLGNIVNGINLSKIRCTVDTFEDFLTIKDLLRMHPGIATDSRFSTLESAICSPRNPLQVTERREAITQGPWMDYPFACES